MWTSSSTVEMKDVLKDEISFEDVLGYGEIGKLMKDNYEYYCTQVKDDENKYGSFNEYINGLVKRGEFDYDIVPQWKENVSLALDCIPIIGDAKGIIEGVVGVDLISGRHLSALERGLCLFSAIPLVGDFGTIVKGGIKVGAKAFAKSGIKIAIKEGAQFGAK